MQHVSYKSIVPFDFQGLQIRELTPGGLQTASDAEIEVAADVRHRRARSTRSDKLYLCAGGTVSFRVEDTDIQLEATEFRDKV